MTLTEVLASLGKLSGRFDLTVDDTDLGKFFINEGSRFLDRHSETQKTWASHYVYLAASGWYVEIPSCRAIKEVWIHNSAGKRWQLEKINIQEMLSDILPQLAATLGTGNSLYYSPAVTRQVPEDGTLPPESATYTDILVSSGYPYTAVIIAPPPNVQILVDVRGLYYSAALVEDGDTNYWSEEHPSTLVKAALREIEIFNRNRQGVKDWEAAIDVDMEALGKDLVEEIIAEVDQMEG